MSNGEKHRASLFGKGVPAGLLFGRCAARTGERPRRRAGAAFAPDQQQAVAVSKVVVAQLRVVRRFAFDLEVHASAAGAVHRERVGAVAALPGRCAQRDQKLAVFGQPKAVLEVQL